MYMKIKPTTIIMIGALILLSIYSLIQLTNEPVTCEVGTLTVEQGDTYWGMTGKANCVGGYDKQDRVGQIIDLNKDVDLYPGLVIVFPTK